MVEYEDGSYFCFSCSTPFKSAPKDKEPEMSKPEKLSIKDVQNLPVRGFKERKIPKDICEFFEVKVSYDEDGDIEKHYYPYDENTVFNVRRLPKTFSRMGKMSKLFGQDKFNAGGKRLIICEGEIDALSVAKAAKDKYNKVYPVVAMPGSAYTNLILNNRKWVRSFQEVVICFDEDAAGDTARSKAIQIIGYDKAKVCKLPEKDANDVLIKKGGRALLNAIFDATEFVPAGIIDKDELWDSLVEYNKIQSIPYPNCLDGLNSKLKGRRYGEITLFISGTGCFQKGTKALRASGESVNIEDVKVGDQLMGDDGTPRTVLKLNRGREQMAKITLRDGSSFVCNKSHILSLFDVNTTKFVDMTLNEYIGVSSNNLLAYKSIFEDGYIHYTAYSFKVEMLEEEDDYYGFQLDGNKRFLLDNFIVVHNCGKSTIMREIVMDVVKNSEEKVGIVALEESPAETARKLSGMALNRNPANEEIPEDELKVGFDEVFKDNRIILLDHQGAMQDNTIIDNIEYMCLMGATTIIIDHITILVSEGMGHLTGNEAQDKMMNELLRIVKTYPVWLGVISHLRKTPNSAKSFEEGEIPTLDAIKGSGSVKQISFDIVGFGRNLTADEDEERNTIRIAVLKSRYSGLTGGVPGAIYDSKTGRLKRASAIDNFTEDMGD
jgi:replicative DNA helicase/5S rRNA maturation endonuclease (ribonuclease M5)